MQPAYAKTKTLLVTNSVTNSLAPISTTIATTSFE
jgi:hypothetical protein